MKNTLYALLAFLFTFTTGFSQIVVSHSVPEEFGSDYYEVTVNGQKVPVFHAGLNVYFASFDFRGEAAVRVTSRYNSNSYSGQTSNKEAVRVDEKGYWREEVAVRPLSKNIKPQLTGPTVTFSLTDPRFIDVEADITKGNFRLAKDSPGQNSGSSEFDLNTDITGKARPKSIGRDRGAFEQ